MKKAFAILVLFAMTFSLFAGCQTSRDPNVLYEDELSEELKTTIKNKVVLACDTVVGWNRTSWGRPYYGTINDCVIVQTHVPETLWYSTHTAHIEVAGYTFGAVNPDFKLCVYRDGEACELQEAYEKGWLTKEQIGKIHEKHQVIYEKYLSAKEGA